MSGKRFQNYKLYTMKVKFKSKVQRLKYSKIYNVLSICDWSNKERKYYISDYSKDHISIIPYDVLDFDIVDGNIPSCGKYWYDNFGNVSLWIPELHTIEYFWSKYYDNDPEMVKIIDWYYKSYSDELFNILYTSEEEKKNRIDRWWEYSD